MGMIHTCRSARTDPRSALSEQLFGSTGAELKLQFSRSPCQTSSGRIRVFVWCLERAFDWQKVENANLLVGSVIGSGQHGEQRSTKGVSRLVSAVTLLTPAGTSFRIQKVQCLISFFVWLSVSLFRLQCHLGSEKKLTRLGMFGKLVPSRRWNEHHNTVLKRTKRSLLTPGEQRLTIWWKINWTLFFFYI